MNLKKVVNGLDDIRDKKERMKIFTYPVMDESNYTDLAGRSLYVEIGGPCASLKLFIENKEEKEIIQDVVTKLIANREANLEKELLCLCKNVIEKGYEL